MTSGQDGAARLGEGKEAMASTRLSHPHRRLRDLWQLPLLVGSLALFGYAAYLFIDPKPGQTIDDRIAVARTLLNQERPDAAIDLLNKLIATTKLDKPHDGKVHLMLAEAIAEAENQKNSKIRVPRKHEQIIEQISLALADDVKPTYQVHRRLAESYEALHNSRMALKHYQQAAALDADHSLRMQRKIIDLQLSVDDAEGAAVSLEEYEQRPDLSESERAWALGESAHLLIDKSRFTDARQKLDAAAKLSSDPITQGQINYWQGYCAWKLKDFDNAEKLLRVSRDQMKERHPLDGDAAYLLGRMAQDKRDWKLANSFYEVVLVDHPDSRLAPLAKLGRGVCRIALANDDAGLTDLHDLANQLNQKESPAKFVDETVTGLREASEMLTNRGNYQGALELLAYEQDLQPKLPPNFFARLGAVYEKRADQLEKISLTAKAAEQIKGLQDVRDLRGKAGDAFVAYSRALTLTDDKGYGEALWHGIDLFDRAGDLRRTASALKLFVTERPEDLLAADALLRLGQAYQAMGMYDEAIAAFQQNIFRHGSALAANKSAIPLAEAYEAKGPEFYGRAESTLKVLLDNPLVTPEAVEFKQSLFNLGQLYYREDKFKEALAKFEELTQRYPNDGKIGQTLFLMADSYRKSALLMRQAPPSTQPTTQPSTPIDPAEFLAARTERLNKAKEFYDRAIAAYEKDAPATEAEKTYLRLSHFYRADCAYDLGQYEDAIRLYDAAAFRYQDDPSALSAYVQIVNSYCALGKFDDARTANERAKVLLKRIPQQAFADGSFSMPKEYWQEWLKWTGQSGLWK